MRHLDISQTPPMAIFVDEICIHQKDVGWTLTVWVVDRFEPPVREHQFKARFTGAYSKQADLLRELSEILTYVENSNAK